MALQILVISHPAFSSPKTKKRTRISSWPFRLFLWVLAFFISSHKAAALSSWSFSCFYCIFLELNTRKIHTSTYFSRCGCTSLFIAVRCCLLFCSQYSSWWSPIFCWPSGFCCTLSYCLDASLCSDHALDVSTETHSQEKNLVLYYPSVSYHLPPVQMDRSNDILHTHHMVPSSLVVPSHGWYWIYDIHRSFLRWAPSQTAAKATQICKFFVPKLALHMMDMWMQSYMCCRGHGDSSGSALRISSNLTPWFSFISYRPEVALLAVEGAVNLKCRYRAIKK